MNLSTNPLLSLSSSLCQTVADGPCKMAEEWSSHRMLRRSQSGILAFYEKHCCENHATKITLQSSPRRHTNHQLWWRYGMAVRLGAVTMIVDVRNPSATLPRHRARVRRSISALSAGNTTTRVSKFRPSTGRRFVHKFSITKIG
jgi:hypothetical protein